MQTESSRLRNIISAGWSGMLALLLLMMITDLIEFGMAGDFSPLNKDPGRGGLWFIAIVICINVLMQMSIRTFSGMRFRAGVFAATVFYTLIFIGHQAVHTLAGQGLEMHAAFDAVHHVLGIWAAVAAYGWMKLPADAAA